MFIHFLYPKLKVHCQLVKVFNFTWRFLRRHIKYNYSTRLNNLKWTFVHLVLLCLVVTSGEDADKWQPIIYKIRKEKNKYCSY